MIVLALGSVGVLGFAAAIAPSFLVLAVIRFTAGLLGSMAPTSRPSRALRKIGKPYLATCGISAIGIPRETTARGLRVYFQARLNPI